MRLLRTAATLVVALGLALAGFAFYAQSKPSVGTVYDTDFRGPKVTVDGRPRLERSPRYRILVGSSRKSARWVQVNAAQYAGCSEGNAWTGTLCSKLDLGSAPAIGTRTILLLGIAAAMVVVPLAAKVGRPRD